MGKRVSHTAVANSFVQFAGDIKIAHSIFALPFAASAFLVAHLPLPTPSILIALLVCMVTGRSFAMGMNRYLDRDIDARNPRTSVRKIPSGKLLPNEALAWSLASASVFVAAASTLNALAGKCALPLLLILGTYPYMKRLSWATHWYLGFCLGLAPLGVAVALTGTMPIPVLLLTAAVTFWTGGFDILYALQDVVFDRQEALQSVPAQFGSRSALLLSRMSFVAMLLCLTLAGLASGAGTLYFAGVAGVAALLGYEHYLVRDAGMDGHVPHLEVAFFNANAYVSVLYFVMCLADVWVRGGFQ